MIGHRPQLDRVQTIFKESMFGPNPEEIFVDEEIAPERKAQGYNVDFLAERATLAYKGLYRSFLLPLTLIVISLAGPDGKEVSVNDFASFVAFDDQGITRLTGKRLKKRKYDEAEGNDSASSNGINDL